jgi:hypothetical protein
MQSNVGRGRTRKSPRAKNGGPTYLQIRARKQERRTDLAVKQAYYRLADEKREIILVACSKCDWRAAFARDELIAAHGADYAMRIRRRWFCSEAAARFLRAMELNRWLLAQTTN